jgi:hypothetical protein
MRLCCTLVAAPGLLQPDPWTNCKPLVVDHPDT